jgi:phage I-like protein
MTDLQTDRNVGQQVDSLLSEVAEMRAAVQALQERATDASYRASVSKARADTANHRADLSEARADKAELRTDDSRDREDAQVMRLDAQVVRMDAFEERLDVDEAMIADLQADGLLSHEHAQQLEQALRSSRLIGAAMGIIMANRRVNETDAFVLLSKGSQNTNRKLRVLAEDIVSTGDVSSLPRS